jgi:purine-binding chemotaxis protein CheW
MAEAMAQKEQLTKAVTEKEGKYLTFALGPEEYGLEILKVREIIGYMDITAVPQTPDHVKGVINLRGQVIPVIDLRAKFGMETAEVTEQTCIIVVETTRGNRNFSTGIVVDRVQEVLDIAGENIEEAPQFGSNVNTDFILGMGKINETVKILLDIDEVLSKVNLDSVQYSERSQTQQVKHSQTEQKKQQKPKAAQSKSKQASQDQPVNEQPESEHTEQEQANDEVPNDPT